MRQELKRIEPLRAANIGALVYGLLGIIFMIIFSPFFLLAGFLGAAQGQGMAGPFFIMLMLVVYPIMGFVFGWISGLLTAAIYNFIVTWTGGLLVEFAEPTVGPGAVV